jgi:hypothetical protein
MHVASLDVVFDRLPVLAKLKFRSLKIAGKDAHMKGRDVLQKRRPSRIGNIWHLP